MKNKILYLLLHTQKHGDRYNNCVNTWLQGQDYLFYSDHEDLEKNIIKVSNRDDYDSNEEKFVNVVKTLPEEYLDYEWYYFGDNDTFVNTKKLESILDTLDTNKFHGQKICSWPGDKDLWYLSGGAGILVSHQNYIEMRDKIEIRETGFSDVCMGKYMKENGKEMEGSELFKSQPPHHYNLNFTEAKDYISFHYIKSMEDMVNLYNSCIMFKETKILDIAKEMICYNCMAELCDYSLDISDEIYRTQHGIRRKNHNHLDVTKLKDGDIIFVKTDFIVNGTFSGEILPNITKKFVLVTGTSDYSLDDTDHFKNILENQNLIHWFTCNPPSENYDKISFIPIGFQEYERLGDNLELLKNNINNDISWEDKLDKIYVPHHSLTNQSRQSIINELSHYSFVEIEKTELSFEDYLNKISRYKFSLSLRGNGWDCHRNYEILYSGSIPVIQEGPISKSFRVEGIPHITLSDLNNEIFNKKFTIDKNILFLNYWENKIKDKI